jgi:hypothetical protein
MSKHLRKYLLFNYDNDYRTMLDNNIIGLAYFNFDLSIVYNSEEPSLELSKFLEKNNIKSKETKEIFDNFLFGIEIGDVICLSDVNQIKAIGIVESNYKYNRNKVLPHSRKIKWINTDVIAFDNGNFRIKIRLIEKEENIKIIEKIVNDNLVENDNDLLVNNESKISFKEYKAFLDDVLLTPNEIEILNIIYNTDGEGISLYEINKLTEDYDAYSTLEALARKICNNLNIDTNGDYLGNIFDGILRDGHICLLINKAFQEALLKTKLLKKSLDIGNNYSLKQASFNSVYPVKWYSKALELILNKRTLLLLGPWGSGKSYFARRLAFLINNSRNMDHIHHIKMHPSQTYENLLVNPQTRKLYQFIEMARKNTIDNYVIIIEDCHQVDLSAVLGEISFLIEDNNRDYESALDVNFNDEKYYIPKNVYVILTSREDEELFNSLDLSNILIFEFSAVYNDKFIKMFNDEELGRFIADKYQVVNDILKKYQIDINHGLFLKGDRGLNRDEYYIVVKFKILPLLKRVVSSADYEIICDIINQ